MTLTWSSGKSSGSGSPGVRATRIALSLPASFYSERALLSDRIASCVLVAPELAPSRTDLPRDEVSCLDLREVLRASILGYHDPARMAQLVARRCGMRYVCHLLSLANEAARDGSWTLVCYLPWYVHRLLEMEALEREFEDRLSLVGDSLSRSEEFLGSD